MVERGKSKIVFKLNITTLCTTHIVRVCNSKYVHLQKKCDHYSSAETIQGRKLLIIKRFWPRKLFKGGNYSRAETIRGNTVSKKLGRCGRQNMLLPYLKIW